MVGRQNKFVNTLMFKMLDGSRDFPIVVTNSGKVHQKKTNSGKRNLYGMWL